jgi:hypothetical protein
MTAMGYLIVVLTFGAVALIVAWVIRADRPPVTKKRQGSKAIQRTGVTRADTRPDAGSEASYQAGEQAAAEAKKKGG